MSKTKLCVALFLGLACLAGLPGAARAQGAPVGVWKGNFADGSGTLTLVLRSNGDCMYNVNNVAVQTGTAEWQQTSPSAAS
jgi:hypothetical protein